MGPSMVQHGDVLQHTGLVGWVVLTLSVSCLFSDSLQGILEKYHFNRKWYFLAGIMSFFVYVYVRPFMRAGLGASRSYVSSYSLYVLWLCGAVFYHLPSFNALGIDIRTDLSMLIVVFLSTMMVMSVLVGIHTAAVSAGILSPRLFSPTARMKDVAFLLAVNAMLLAISCSTYHSFCGNGMAASTPAQDTTMLKHAVCRQWLPPILTSKYPKFSAWMIYGEGQGSSTVPKMNINSSSTPGSSYVGAIVAGSSSKCTTLGCNSTGIFADMCMSAFLNSSSSRCTSMEDLQPDCNTQSAEGDRLSPVFTMWITMIMLYLATSLADYVATGNLQASHVAEMRGALQEVVPTKSIPYSARQGTQQQRGTGTTNWTPGGGGVRSKATIRSRGVLELKRPISKTWGQRLVNRTLTTLTRQASTLGSSAAHYLEPGSLVSQLVQHVRSTIARQLPMPLYTHPVATNHHNTHPHLHSTHNPNQLHIQYLHSESSRLERSAVHGGSGRGGLGVGGGMRHGISADDLEDVFENGLREGEVGAQPKFLPMVPWYSGTSADLFITGFDLMVSMKLFLGRFDMRTMQAATASSMADSFNDSTPAEGDGFTYEQYDDRAELWFDFIADTGDGGNPTYTIARALAAPSLTVPISKGSSLMAEAALAAAAGVGGSSQLSKDGDGMMTLPRGELLLIGGDLAYPNPSQENYEERLFRPFQDALPPPAHYHPGRLVVHKPDLPPVYGVQEATLPGGPRGMSPRTSRHASAAALRSYTGPHCFAIPGNHDWIDGLETFIKHILHKGWLGGWLLPQEKSYFAISLPHGWWQFGLDLALVGDLDMCQYRYFANLVEQRMQPDDQVIILTHEPLWLTDWFWQRPETEGANLRQLIRGHLRGRARVWFSGDLHFYMRHSFMQNPAPASAAEAVAVSDVEAAATAAADSATTPSSTATAASVMIAKTMMQGEAHAPSASAASRAVQSESLSSSSLARAPVIATTSTPQAAPAGSHNPSTATPVPHSNFAPTVPASAGKGPVERGTWSSNDSSPAPWVSTPNISATEFPFRPPALSCLSTNDAQRQPGSPCFSRPHHQPHASSLLSKAISNAAAEATHHHPSSLPIPTSSFAFNDPRPAYPSAESNHNLPLQMFQSASCDLGVQTPCSPQRSSLTLSPGALSRAMMFPHGSAARYPYLDNSSCSTALAPVGASTTSGSGAVSWKLPTSAAMAAAAAAGGSIAGGSSILGGSSDDEDALSDGGFSILSGTSNCHSHWPGHPGCGTAIPMVANIGNAESNAAVLQNPGLYGSSPGGASSSSVGRQHSKGTGSQSRRRGRDGAGSRQGGSVRNLRALRQLPGLRLDAPEGVTFGSDGTGSSVKVQQGATAVMAPATAQKRASNVVSAAISSLCQSCQVRLRDNHHMHDPDHLICNGAGGAFLHPTHIFAPARFSLPVDSAAEATASLYSAAMQPCTCRVYPAAQVGWNSSTATWSYPSGPQPHTGPSLQTAASHHNRHTHTSLFRSTPVSLSSHAHQASSAHTSGHSNPHLAGEAATSPAVPESLKGSGGQYVCAASYPTPEKSLEIGRRNVHVFRSKNTRFDVIGGVFYFLLIVSVIPRCSPIAAVVDAATASEAVLLLASAFFDTLIAIFSTSFVSLGAVLLMFAVTLGLAKAGGAGLLTTPSKHGPVPQARIGGLPTQLMLAFAHTATHVSLAILLMLLLELGVETCIRHEHLGEEGYHSLYRWYRSYEAEHFPDPMGLRFTLETWTLGLYPSGLKYCMALFDIPEAIAVTRASMCSNSGSVSHLTRIQAMAYYMGMLAYYWLLATPAMGFVFGIYLYISVCVLRIHYDEAFSALRVPNFKALTRCHINRDGDLELFTLAIDKVPHKWREDPRWRGARGGGNPSLAAHLAAFPSRWLPVFGDKHSGSAAPDEDELDEWPERGSSSSSSSNRPAVTKIVKKSNPPHKRWNPLRSRGSKEALADVEFKLVDYLKVTARRYPVTL